MADIISHTTAHAIEVRDVSFTYPNGKSAKHALIDLDLTVRQGEFVCLLGPSGSGKSTLFRVLAGLLPGYQGQIDIFGQALQGPGTDRALVFQDYSLFPWMTAIQNVRFGMKRAKPDLAQQDINQQADHYLHVVELSEHRHKYPAELSGGMKQRVAIARALAMDASLLLLDEPFGALDAKLRGELQQLLIEIWQQDDNRRACFFITHDIEEAMLLGDRILFMHDGRIIKSTLAPCHKPRTLETLNTIGSCQHLREELLSWFYLVGRQPTEEHA